MKLLPSVLMVSHFTWELCKVFLREVLGSLHHAWSLLVKVGTDPDIHSTIHFILDFLQLILRLICIFILIRGLVCGKFFLSTFVLGLVQEGLASLLFSDV